VSDRPSAAELFALLPVGDAALAEELAAIDALPLYLSREETWTFLRISESTLDRACDRGDLARRRIGGQSREGRTLIPRSSIRAWVLREAGSEPEGDDVGNLVDHRPRMGVPKPPTERRAT
jgi:hypothetical protein